MDSIGLKDLDQFNAEIKSLCDANIPLGIMASLDCDSTTLAGFQGRIANQLALGYDLATAVQTAPIPHDYQALIMGGVQIGKLSRMLEEVTRHADLIPRFQRQLRRSLFYPALIAVVASAFFLGHLTFCFPILQSTYATFQLAPQSGYQWVAALDRFHGFWIGLPILGGLSLLWWIARLWASRTPPGHSLAWLPGGGRLAFELQAATFAELLAVLTEHDVPLAWAMPWAAQLSQNRRLFESAQAWQESLTSHANGIPPARVDNGPQPSTPFQFAPLLAWAVVENAGKEAQASTLRTVANAYRTNAMLRMERLKVLLPALGCILIAGLATLAYALSVFVPLIQLLLELTHAVRV